VRAGRTYRFQGWSDGGAIQHQISVPEGSPQYTATYRADGVDTLVFTPVADTHVDDLNPALSYGTLPDVEVDSAPERREALLKFNLSGIDGRQVLGARLAMQQVDDPDGSPYGGDVHTVSSNSWTEATTWNTKPTLGAKLASFGPVVFGRGYEADLGTAAVMGDGLLSLGMRTPDANGSRWGSRESATPPRLIVEVKKYECADGVDNDGDGNADFPADLGCLSATDRDENQAPVAQVGATPAVGDAPLTVQFDGSGSSDPEGDPVSYEWDFGDGTAPSNLASPSHTYATPGDYTATLTVRDGHGHSDTDSVAIEVTENEPPVAVVGATPAAGDAPLVVQFSGGGSTDPDGDALGYEWDFGDGTLHSSAASPSHTYATPGDYTATLTVDDGHGHAHSASVEIRVSAPAGGGGGGTTDPPPGGGGGGTTDPPPGGGGGGTTDPPPGGGSGGTTDSLVQPPPFSGADIESGRVTVRRGAASVEIACPADAAGSCVGRLVVSARLPATGGAAARAKTVRLGTASFSIPRGDVARVRVKLSRRARRLLEQRRRLRVKATATARDGFMRERITTSSLVLRMSPPRRPG
jgi:PKD repeat protein